MQHGYMVIYLAYASLHLSKRNHEVMLAISPYLQCNHSHWLIPGTPFEND